MSPKYTFADVVCDDDLCSLLSPTFFSTPLPTSSAVEGRNFSSAVPTTLSIPFADRSTLQILLGIFKTVPLCSGLMWGATDGDFGGRRNHQKSRFFFSYLEYTV